MERKLKIIVENCPQNHKCPLGAGLPCGRIVTGRLCRTANRL